ncbi:MAG: response regulator [Acidobacteria bacterium]|nr:response regulator [Acidobacteriota bacterium]
MQPLLDAEVLRGFRDEVEGYLPTIRAALRRAAGEAEEPPRLEEARELTHNIRAAATIMGLAALGEQAATLEAALEAIGGPNQPLDEPTLEALLEAVDGIERALPEVGPPTAPSRANDAVAQAPSRPAGSAPSGPLWIDDEAGPPADLADVFRAEADDLLASLGDAVTALRRDPSDQERLQELRRVAHTLKGAAAMVGLRNASRLAHRLEDGLDGLVTAGGALSSQLASLVVDSIDVLEELTRPGPHAPALRDRTLALHQALEETTGNSVGRLSEAVRRQEDRPPPPAPAEPPRVEEPVAASGFARVPVERIDELVRLSGELIVARSAMEERRLQSVRQIEELSEAVDRLQRLAVRIEEGVTAAKAGTAGGGGESDRRGSAFAAQFDELELDRYSDLYLLAQDLAEVTADLAATGSALRRSGGDLQQEVRRLDRLTSHTQERLMGLRMAPLSGLRRRMERTVRVTAADRGKNVELELSGDVEVDKNVLDAIAGPFEHLLRNAVDHGIEPPTRRVELGKPETGRIRVESRLDGVQAVIEVSDDGGGFNLERLRAEAVVSGAYTRREADRLSSEELHRLAFHSGLSTAESLSEISGRGVGLDAVRGAVAALGGSIVARSEAGRGSCFVIRLPTTLAAARVLLVQAAGQTFALPLHAVPRALRGNEAELEKGDSGPWLRRGDEALPLIRLAEALGLPAAPLPKLFSALEVETDGRRYVLQVDRVRESRDVVVKSLGPLLRRTPGVAGATILGAGDICLILNPAELFDRAKAAQEQSQAVRGETVARRPLRVLVVDDSLSVRRVVASVLEQRGWEALPARDGLHALEVLSGLAEPPDAVLADVEMPRMDGFELTSSLRALEGYRELPIVMLTSRAGEKHRRHAFELGVDAYLIKPFQPDQLVKTLERVARRSQEEAASS